MEIPGEIREHPLASLTSWHIGGNAERFYHPATKADLQNYMEALPAVVPCTWLGLGSNVLIRDGGISGAVICTRKLQNISLEADGSIIVDAGMTCAKFARFCSRNGFPEGAFFAGIPGTIGGALAMNAGAFGGETWPWVQRVEVINRQGEIYFREPKDYHIAYRTVKGKESIQAEEAFISAVFKFPHNKNIDGMEKIKALLRQRGQTQPIGTFNCGSVYRNPPGDFAARLIEGCGLKGYQIGDAMISPIHANFIINQGKATSQDIEAMMHAIEAAVWAKFNTRLQAEVRILGNEKCIK